MSFFYLGQRVVPLLLFIIMMIPAAGLCHDLSLTKMTLQEKQAGSFMIRWMKSGPYSMGGDVVFPDHCTVKVPVVDCGEKGLHGKIGFGDVNKQQPPTLVRIEWQDGRVDSYTLTSSQPAVMIAQGGIGWRQVALTYLPFGIEHILLGVDHLLFVLGLIWIVGNPWMLVKTITAFTIAHTLTLAVATFELVTIPERSVNGAIALSIVFVAVEIVKKRQGHVGLTGRYPWLVAFGFGLLHGLGFAGALTQLGLPAENIPLALLFFNIGVEIGQVGFVFLILALQWSHRILAVQLPRWSEPIPAYVIGTCAMFWFIGRLSVIIT